MVLLLLPCAAAGLLAPSLPSLPKIGNLGSVMGPRCDKLLPTLFSDTLDPAAVAAACSSSVEWVDMDLKEPIRGPEAVEAHLASKFPAGSKLMIERLADGGRSGGFSWHREADGIEGSGLRGVTYVELDDAGQIAYVQEGAEPIFKLDKLLEALLTAANANKKDDDGKPPPSYVKATPTTANGIVKYLWEVAHPSIVHHILPYPSIFFHTLPYPCIALYSPLQPFHTLPSSSITFLPYCRWPTQAALPPPRYASSGFQPAGAVVEPRTLRS